MKVGTKEFTQGASSQYKSITVDEKDNLRQRCLETSTTREIKLEGRRIFKSISLKVSPLCVCGYPLVTRGWVWSFLVMWNPGFHFSLVVWNPGFHFSLVIWNPRFHLSPTCVEPWVPYCLSSLEPRVAFFSKYLVKGLYIIIDTRTPRTWVFGFCIWFLRRRCTSSWYRRFKDILSPKRYPVFDGTSYCKYVFHIASVVWSPGLLSSPNTW